MYRGQTLSCPSCMNALTGLRSTLLRRGTEAVAAMVRRPIVALEQAVITRHG